MKPLNLPLLWVLLFLLNLTAWAEPGESHRATVLGNPATAFAPTLFTPSDLRARFADPALRPDILDILKQWGWTGDPADLFAAAATHEIVDWDIPVGEVMPFMSSRSHGHPVCLRNVTWAGWDPIHAYAFTFASTGRLWRCITPKPCSNFFVEDLGPVPVAGLTMDCSVADQVSMGHLLQVCLSIHNTGNIPATNISVNLPIPKGIPAMDATEGGNINTNQVSWVIANLAPDGTKELCTALRPRSPGTVEFNSSAVCEGVPPLSSSCSTEIIGLPALLLEKSDNPDPVAVGSNTLYTVKVTNQGSAPDRNIAITIIVDSQLAPVTADPAEAIIQGQTVTFPVVASLAAKQVVTCTLIARGVQAGDAHTRFVVNSQMLSSPLTAEESTTVY